MSGVCVSWLLFSLLSKKPIMPTCLFPPHSWESHPAPAQPHPIALCPSPRAMRKTRMMRMMVGLMGKAALISISSSVMPMTDSSTMARSSWFHLLSRAGEGKSGRQGEKRSSLEMPRLGGASQISTLLMRPTAMCGHPPYQPHQTPLSLAPSLTPTASNPSSERLTVLNKHLWPPEEEEE